jgi:hypothetical protein
MALSRNPVSTRGVYGGPATTFGDRDRDKALNGCSSVILALIDASAMKATLPAAAAKSPGPAAPPGTVRSPAPGSLLLCRRTSHEPRALRDSEAELVLLRTSPASGPLSRPDWVRMQQSPGRSTRPPRTGHPVQDAHLDFDRGREFESLGLLFDGSLHTTLRRQQAWRLRLLCQFSRVDRRAVPREQLGRPASRDRASVAAAVSR